VGSSLKLGLFMYRYAISPPSPKDTSRQRPQQAFVNKSALAKGYIQKVCNRDPDKSKPKNALGKHKV
jgi:hypothetical protein